MSKKQPQGAVNRAEQVARVIELMESGYSERGACESVGINRATFRTAAARTGVANQYARALEGMARSQIELMESTIQDMRDGTVTEQMAKIELDARKWFASKFLPREFGDKQQVDHTSSDGSMSPSIDATKLSDAALAELMAARNAVK